MVNVGLGIAVFENSCGVGARNYSILWIYIAFVGFLLATQVSLFIVFTVIAFREKDSTGMALKIGYNHVSLALNLQLREDLPLVFSDIFCQARQRKMNDLNQLDLK